MYAKSPNPQLLVDFGLCKYVWVCIPFPRQTLKKISKQIYSPFKPRFLCSCSSSAPSTGRGFSKYSHAHPALAGRKKYKRGKNRRRRRRFLCCYVISVVGGAVWEKRIRKRGAHRKNAHKKCCETHWKINTGRQHTGRTGILGGWVELW